MKTVLLDPTPREQLMFLQEFAPNLQLVAPTSDAPDELASLLADAEALLTRRRRVDAALLQASDRLRFVQLWSNRRDGIDLEAAREAGVTVARMPQRGCIAVAELTLLLMLGLSKKIVQAHQATRTGAYRDLDIEPERTAERKHKFQWMKLPDLFELNGKTIGLVGFGEIATEVARRARSFGMTVLYTKRQRLVEDLEWEEGVQYRSLDGLLQESDFVSLHVPHTELTERMMGAEALAKMKRDAYLINTCRGGVVDEEALVDALENGRIAGAGLDVFLYEPIPHDHPLLALENVLLTPHIGGGSGGARVKQARDVMDNLERVARGDSPLHIVTGGER